MAANIERGALYRQVAPHRHSRVAELFFDLVFVFAVTQISHTLLGRLTPQRDHGHRRGVGIDFAATGRGGN